MLRIYICPKCFNFRMVSRQPDAICFHCGEVLEKCNLEYSQYMNMTEEERNTYKANYIERMKQYQDRMDVISSDKHTMN